MNQLIFFFSSRRRHTRFKCDWSSDVCSSDLWRIAVTRDPWGAWSPFGNLFAVASRALLTDGQMQAAHLGVWWFHLATVFGFIAWAPYTKMMHAITAPLNIYTASLAPLGA